MHKAPCSGWSSRSHCAPSLGTAIQGKYVSFSTATGLTEAAGMGWGWCMYVCVYVSRPREERTLFLSPGHTIATFLKHPTMLEFVVLIE